MKILHCRDAGFDCATVVRGQTDDEIMAQVRPHASDVHGVEVTPEVDAQLRSLVRNEQ